MPSSLETCQWCSCRACARCQPSTHNRAAMRQPHACLISDNPPALEKLRSRDILPDCPADVAATQPAVGKPLPRTHRRFGDPVPLEHSQAPTVAGVFMLHLSSLLAPIEIPGMRAVHSISYPVHNRETTVRASLNSLLATTAGVWELTVVLDACTDSSEAIVWETLHDFAVTRAPALLAQTCMCVDGAGGVGVNCEATECRLARDLQSGMHGRQTETPASPAGDAFSPAGPAAAPAAPIEEPDGPIAPALLSVPLRVLVVRAMTPLFETASDNLVMSATSPSGFYVLAQSDLIVHEAVATLAGGRTPRAAFIPASMTL